MENTHKTGVSVTTYRIVVTLVILTLTLSLPVLIGNVVLIVKSHLFPDNVADFFGYKPFIVVSGSMEHTINMNDLILTKKVDPSTLEADGEHGSIVSFKNEGTVITHRLIGRTEKDGQPAFISKGDANNAADPTPVTYDMIEGLYVLRVPQLGGISLFMQTPLGLLLCVFLPISLFFGLDLLHRSRRKKRADAARSEEI